MQYVDRVTDPGVEQRGHHVLARQALDGGSFPRGLLNHDDIWFGGHGDGGDLGGCACSSREGYI